MCFLLCGTTVILAKEDENTHVYRNVTEIILWCAAKIFFSWTLPSKPDSWTCFTVILGISELCVVNNLMVTVMRSQEN